MRANFLWCQFLSWTWPSRSRVKDDLSNDRHKFSLFALTSLTFTNWRERRNWTFRRYIHYSFFFLFLPLPPIRPSTCQHFDSYAEESSCISQSVEINSHIIKYREQKHPSTSLRQPLVTKEIPFLTSSTSNSYYLFFWLVRSFARTNDTHTHILSFSVFVFVRSSDDAFSSFDPQ